MAKFEEWDRVQDALNRLRDREEISWVLVGYKGAGNELSLVASEEGGAASLKRHLSTNDFSYGLIRLHNPKELQHSHKVTTRDIFFSVQPPGVPIMKRGKRLEHLGAVQQKFEPNHGQIVVKNVDLLSDAAVLEKSDPKAGSHILE